jgi:aspartate racemase
MPKRIGMLGGVSTESTADYYLIITREYIRQRPDLHCPEIILYSVDLQDFLDLENGGHWDIAADRMVGVFRILARAGAQIGLIATNTLHRVYDEVAARSPIPLISIVEATGKAIRARGMNTVGLLGTRFTMENRFYIDGLARLGINAFVPEDVADRSEIHRIVVDDLPRGKVEHGSRTTIREISEKMRARGAEGIILGCTELPLLVRDEDLELPVFNTTRIHALAALRGALEADS